MGTQRRARRGGSEKIRVVRVREPSPLGGADLSSTRAGKSRWKGKITLINIIVLDEEDPKRVDKC